MAHRLSRWLTAAAVMLLTLSCAAQLPGSLRFDHLGIADGLSQSTVSHILQDRQGYMWFCTDDGINRYDGYRFKVYRRDAGRPGGMQSTELRHLHQDSAGGIWAIGNAGVARYEADSDHFVQVGGIITLSGSSYAMTEWRGKIYFTGNGQLYGVDTRSKKLSVSSIEGCDAPQLLAGVPGGGLLLRDGRRLFHFHTLTKALRPLHTQLSAYNIQNSAPAQDALVWLLGDGGAVLYDAAGDRVLREVQTAGHYIICAAFDAKGLLWLGTKDGLLCADTATGRYKDFTTVASGPPGLPGKTILCFARDRSGILWIGTNENGLAKLAYNKFKFGGFASENGLPGKAVLALEEDDAGAIWMGTERGSIAIYDPATGAFSRCDRSTGCALRTEGAILSLLRAGSVMYCAHEAGVDAVSLRTHRVVGSPLVSEGAFIKKLYTDGTGRIWALGAKSLYLYDTLRKAFLAAPLPPLRGRLQNMIEDGLGFLWLSSGNGLLRYNPAMRTATDYGLKAPRLFQGAITIALCRDARGDVWMGSYGTGLLRYDAVGDSFVVHGAAGLSSPNIYALLCDRTGRLWLSTNGGISRYDPRARTFTNFNVADGLLSNEGIGRSALRDSRGVLWFGNTGGVNMIDPAVIPVNASPPLPHITGFKVFDKDIPFEAALREWGGIRLRQAQNYFTVEYSAMDYTQPEENTYRVRLLGFDPDWRAMSTAHSTSYTNLDGGSYTLQIMAYNSDGVPCVRPLSLPIYIAPHFYRTWWFYLLVTLAISGSAYAFYRYRINALKKELRLRTAIAADLHDDVGATLSSIKMLSAILKPKLGKALPEAAGTIDTIHQRASTTLEAMSDIVWSINPKNDAGEHLIARMKTYASELLDDSDLDYRFIVNEATERLKFPQHMRKELYLIYKEALNNAIKYSGGTRIEIAVAKSGNRFSIQVSDNGKGFERAALSATTKGGNGLKNMEARAAAIGGELLLKSAVGEGTTVLLSIPLTHIR